VRLDAVCLGGFHDREQIGARYVIVSEVVVYQPGTRVVPSLQPYRVDTETSSPRPLSSMPFGPNEYACGLIVATGTSPIQTVSSMRPPSEAYSPTRCPASSWKKYRLPAEPAVPHARHQGVIRRTCGPVEDPHGTRAAQRGMDLSPVVS